jgi:predicted nucleic acid-binding protein
VICVDASVAAKWVLAEDYSDRALALFHDTTSVREATIAPPLLPIEVTNIIRQRIRRNILTEADAERILTQFLAFPVTLMSIAELHLAALRLANQFDLPATYDAHYVALAQLTGSTLWTNDRRLVRNLTPQLPFLRWIGEYD